MSHPPVLKKKFQRLLHKKSASLLREIVNTPRFALCDSLAEYRKIEKMLGLVPVHLELEELSNRFHLHLEQGALPPLSEDRLLSPKRREAFDALSSDTPFLPLFIYLDHLRSSHNVGSILRTIEAFRLGTPLFSPQTPDLSHPKVQKTSMHTIPYLPQANDSLPHLKRPWIALETGENSIPYSSYSFPPGSFTLIVGNEEYGVSSSLLKEADAIVSIPLVGCKKSLNVACAFAIIAAEISRQKRKEKKPISHRGNGPIGNF